MKKIFLVLALLIFGVMSCGKKENGDKKLRVGLNAIFAPFEYVENGQVTGFDVDLINEIGKNLGYKVEIIDQSFDGLIPALKAGKIDIIVSGMSSTEERKKSVDFTDEYFKSTQVYLRKKGNIAVNSKESLAGKKVGVQLGTIQELEAKKIKNANITNVNITNNEDDDEDIEYADDKKEKIVIDKKEKYLEIKKELLKILQSKKEKFEEIARRKAYYHAPMEDAIVMKREIHER